jgi:hypothetical protein
LVTPELNQMRAAVTCRQLHKAEPVARGNKTQSLGIDRHHRPKINTVRQIAFVKPDFHLNAPAPGNTPQIGSATE